MTKHMKIILSGSRDIPFDQLVLSQANVRRVKAGVSIDALAADIARRGLLQSLTVRAQHDENGLETGKFEVPAGGRRFRALQLLVKQRKMTKTQGVPCIVRDDDTISAEEDSLAENTHREPLHPLDQFRAMRGLVEQGVDIETVAATFMVTPAVVKQRLRLASVSPKLHEVYAEDGMTLEQLMAFAVSEDHDRQELVWEQIKDSYQNEAYYIRRRLTEETVRASDKRVRFVTLDAYVAAGGYVLRDLFEEDGGGWLQDVVLLDRLVDEKLKAEGDRIGAEGWKWVAVALDFPYGHRFDLRELNGEPVPMSEDEESRLAALREEADQLENEWSDADEIPDEVEARITTIDEEIAALLARPLTFDPEEQVRAGAFVSIDTYGSLHVDRGYVRAEDEPAGDADPDDDDDGLDGGDDTGAVMVGATVVTGMPGVNVATDDEEQDDLLRPIPDRLVSELTAYRTMALRDALALSPQVAFAAVLHAFVLDSFYSYSSDATCLQASIRSPYLGSHAPNLGDFGPAKAVDARHESWSERLPDAPADLWDALTALDADEQAALFAHCASFGVNALWEAATRNNSGSVSARTVSGRIEHSHVVARATGLDMVAAGWTPTVSNYLGRVTKPHILAAVEQAKGAEAADRIAGLKKPDMARAAEDVLAGAGWLAEPLRTPDIEGPDTDGGVTAIDPEPVPGEDAFDEAYAVAAE